MKQVDYALSYAKVGLHVFPLIANSKEPAVKWTDEATTDPEKIKAWWQKRPRSNIGVAPGLSGCVVVDLDDKGKKNGSKVWAELVGNEKVDTLTVITPTGGRHLYFTGAVARSGTDRLGEGVDIKSAGGYVVGAGSVIDGRQYKVSRKVDMAKVPGWLANHLTPPREKSNKNLGVDLDTPAAVRAATRYLEEEEPAVEGEGGDAHTYRVAARVLDFGVSPGVALDLMLDHWNERNEPPWDHPDLAKKIENASRYRTEPLGVSSPDLAFDKEVVPAKIAMFQPKPWPDVQLLPPRQWVLGRALMKNKVSMLVADPGAGKSTLALTRALAVILGRDDITAEQVHETGKVLVINNEDELEELYRRLYAVMQHYGISKADIGDRLLLYSGVDEDPFIVARRNNKDHLVSCVDGEMIANFRDSNVAVVMVDPLVETHQADENSNVEMSFVARQYRHLAQQCGMSVLLVHHTSKPQGASPAGYAGNMHRSRGAGSPAGVARIVQTLYGMSEQDAELHGVAPDQRNRYARLDDAKANLSLQSIEPHWFFKEEVTLPNSDKVGVFVPVVLQQKEMADADEIARVLIPLVEAEGQVSLNAAAEALAEDPFFLDEERTSLARKVKKHMTKPYEGQGWRLWIEAVAVGKTKRYSLIGERLDA